MSQADGVTDFVRDIPLLPVVLIVIVDTRKRRFNIKQPVTHWVAGFLLLCFPVKPHIPDGCSFLSGHMEYFASGDSGYRTGNADARSHMDVRYEPEQHQHLYRNLVHSRGHLSEEIHTKRETINMKSSEIIKETLHRADGVLYPVAGRKDKVLQKITGCGRNSKKQDASPDPDVFNG